MPVSPGTYKYWIAPWVWQPDSDVGDHWRAPDGTVGLVDLRPAGAALGSRLNPEGFGFFAIEAPAPDPAGGLLLGDDLGGVVSTAARRDAEQRLELAVGDLALPSVLENGWLALTNFADPSGTDRVKPVMPTIDGNLELHLGGHSIVKRVRFDASRHDFVRQVLCGDYRRLVAETGVTNRGTEFARSMLTGISRRYGYAPNEIAAPSGGASYSDDFNRADESLDVSANWTEVDGNWSVVSNAVQGPSSSGSNFPSSVRYEQDLDSADHYAQVTAVSDSPDNSPSYLPGAHVRFSASAETMYSSDCSMLSRSNNCRIRKVESGADTVLAGPVSNGNNAPYTVRLEVNGSGLDLIVAGVSKTTVTDTAITGNTRAGFGNHHSTVTTGTFDDFETADLAAGTPPVRRRIGLLGVDR